VLDEAIKKITGSGLKPSDVIQGQDNADGPAEVRYRAHVAFSTAHDMLRQMEKITNRRKAVVWVSNGYDFNPAESRLARTRPAAGSARPAMKGCSSAVFNQGALRMRLARELAEVTHGERQRHARTMTRGAWWRARTRTSN
jgi:hypothetical protein